jgi:hypothetical protein
VVQITLSIPGVFFPELVVTFLTAIARALNEVIMELWIFAISCFDLFNFKALYSSA